MLELYKSYRHFVEALRCADAASETRSEMRFVAQMRFRFIRKHPRMTMTAKEWQRLTMLAIEGGWDGSPCVEAEDYA
jgi:hypothetical protein